MLMKRSVHAFALNLSPLLRWGNAWFAANHALQMEVPHCIGGHCEELAVQQERRHHGAGITAAGL